MIFMVTIFITTTLILAGLVHYYIYFTAIKFLSITAVSTKTAILISLFALTVSYIIASILAHWFNNFFVKWFYVLSASWYGLLSNLLIMVTAAWIIYWLAKLIKTPLNLKALAIGFGAVALVFTLYGIYNACNPSLKHITVQIKNLPEAWRDITAVQLSDVHLGVVNGERFISEVVEKANSAHPDIVFITGDFFDGTGPVFTDLVKPLREIKTKYGIFFVNGNHETYINTEKAHKALDDNFIKILRDEIVIVDGMQIVGADYPTRGIKKDMAPLLASIDPDMPSILMYHEPRYTQEVRKAGVDLQLAGHTHKGQLKPWNFFTWMIYGKYHAGLTTEGDYNMYTSPGTGTWGPPVRTGSRSEITVIKFR